MQPVEYHGGRVRLYPGDCLETLKGLPSDSVDLVLTDPPYAIASILKRFGAATATAAKDPAFARLSDKFRGCTWDTGEVAFSAAFWAEVLRVAKPGAFLIAFGGTATLHRQTTAVEAAGFEIRDMLGWLYLSGQVKSHDVAKLVARHDPEAARALEGFGTGVKPGIEPATLARKPLVGTIAQNLHAYGTGAVNVAAGMIDPEDGLGLRFPSNVCVDGSPEVDALYPEGAARLLYAAKADAHDRAGSDHATVKPLSLLRRYARMYCPAGGTILDPFAGSGTLGEAALLEGFSAILCEREPDYCEHIARRMDLVFAGPAIRRAESAKARNKAPKPAPLFGES